MDINTTQSISSITRINQMLAKGAFEASKKESEVNLEDNFKDDDIKLMDKKIQKEQVDVADIQKYAQAVGETLTTEDINYGLMYGRSVIADYSA